jgi:hypothetical protein
MIFSIKISLNTPNQHKTLNKFNQITMIVLMKPHPVQTQIQI